MIEIFGDMVTIISTFSIFIFVVVLILILAYFSTRYIGKGIGHYQNSRYMRIIDRIFIGQDKAILIIKIGERYCLFATSQSGIQLLMEFSKEEIDTTFSNTDITFNKIPNFTEIFSEKFKKNK